MAVELAHTRTIIHRDLKPENIMLGDFGEVYVIDWGLARELDQRDPASASSRTPLAGQTEAGEMLGTPGYMAPEQIHDASAVGAAADVYSLGCILFEILSGKPMHPRGHGAIASTLDGSGTSPAARNPDHTIGPELDELCVAALASNPQSRPTARELAACVEHYLDGNRDLERRRELAARHLDAARKAVSDPARRAEAMRASGRALALDPDSADAAALVTQLMLEPPSEHPPELTHRLAEIDAKPSMQAARKASRLVLIWFAMLPLIAWNGVKSWSWLIAISIFVAAFALWSDWEGRTNRSSDTTGLLFASVLIMLLSRVAGPFLLAPILVGLMLMALGQQAQLIKRPYVLIGVALTTFLGPIALEATGGFANSVAIRDGAIAMSSQVLDIEAPWTLVLLTLANVMLIIAMGLFASSLAADRRGALRQLEIRAWHLEQLLPT